MQVEEVDDLIGEINAKVDEIEQFVLEKDEILANLDALDDD